MAIYTISGQYNPDFSIIPDFWQAGFFFNEPVHLSQQTTEPVYWLTAVNQRTGKIEARCALFIRGAGAVSPGAAPFGSIEFAETLPDSALDAFLNALVEAVRANGALTTLRLVNYPHCYAPKQATRLTAKLPEHGFQIIDTYQTFFLPVSTGAFDQMIVPAERRRLRKCREAGFRFAYQPAPDIDKLVESVQEMRQQLGYQLTLQPADLSNLLQTFPERFVVFTVSDGPRLSALTVAVRVREGILYNFLPVSHPTYKTYSPTVMLTAGLMTYCQQQRIRLLDLGTSLDGSNQPKPSLIRFKRNLGAQESPKLVFELWL